MFEITGDDIARLNDADLRTLVARLAIAELRAKGLAVSGVTAGGSQDAGDGGLDVRVEQAQVPTSPDFVPRARTGFQVKKPDMPTRKILEEMRPKGVLRPVIAELAKAGGAYVIVSAQGSVADAPLRARKAAMRQALADCAEGDNLATDFYDRERLASWAEQYPGVAAWIRARVGRELAGWRPVGQWSGTATIGDGGYLVNDAAGLIDERSSPRQALTVLEGIGRLRGLLAQPGHCVRLIGLSGLGKTRLVEALFEVEVGQDPLDPALSVYTDFAHDLTPSAREMARRLVESRQRAILIVDNCNPATHGEIAALCALPDS